jgi:parallel beta-helix repeat protein
MKRVEDGNSRIFKIEIFAILMIIVCTCSAVSAESLRVDSAREGVTEEGTAIGGNYTSIQDAVDAADPEDTIFISPGTYVENLKIDKQVRIWSKSRTPEDTVIKAADPEKSTVEISADMVSFSGFGIEGSEKAGISLTGAKNCFVNNNKVYGTEYGILLINSGSNKISDNIVTLNEKGLKLESSGSNDIEDNLIAYNYGSGISLEESRRNAIYNNYLKNAENVEKKAVNSENIWHSPLVTRQNIVKGPYIAGNFWADLEGKGYSETCTDENNNGICDASYNVTGGGIDKSPLFPKYPNVVKTLEKKLNDSASVYEKGVAGKEETSAETPVETEEKAGEEAEEAAGEEVESACVNITGVTNPEKLSDTIWNFWQWLGGWDSAGSSRMLRVSY